MPPLDNPRWENFAWELAKGKTACEAYVLAGYKPNDGNAIRLKGNERLQARVRELQERAAANAAERCVVTRQSLIQKAEALYKQAKEAGQVAAGVAALKEIGVLSGIRIERSERGQPGEFDWVEKLSTTELRALANGELDIEAYRNRAVN